MPQTRNSPLGILGALEVLSFPFTFGPGAAGPEGPGDRGCWVAGGETAESVVNTKLVETSLRLLEHSDCHLHTEGNTGSHTGIDKS